MDGDRELLMNHSKRSHEGYLLIDHRASPGITEADLATVPEARRAEFQAATGIFEAPTVRCCHCGVIVIINPDRKRPRHHCPKCDHYVCDTASCVLTCTPFVQKVDDTMEQAARLLNLREV
jgi:hypothetical protein